MFNDVRHLMELNVMCTPAVGPQDKDLCYSSGPGTSWVQGGFCPNDADIVRTGAKSFCGMTKEGIYYVINPSKEIPWTGVNELGQYVFEDPTFHPHQVDSKFSPG
uniref:Uncharacterized protein n=1 Tax=Cryptomonas curvata TaxID=233186 RepID=A0A7S0QSI9_9CRYP|mmetsp:Transcript_59431/g.124198  ORF Transcript_59431/g.124198 Transcript_59431/m.124198 type:complete len:105 (+) Transcript_59431:11-325(+)